MSHCYKGIKDTASGGKLEKVVTAWIN